MSGRAGIAPRVGAGLVAVAFLVGMAARSLIGTDSSNGAPTEPPQSGEDQDRGPGPWTIDDDGIPMGFARTRVGAVAAAASYVATGQALLDLPPTQLPRGHSTLRLGRDRREADRGPHRPARRRARRAQCREGPHSLPAGSARDPTRFIQPGSSQRGRLVDRCALAPRCRRPPGGLDDLGVRPGVGRRHLEGVGRDDHVGPCTGPERGTAPVDAAELDRLLAGYQPWSPVR